MWAKENVFELVLVFTYSIPRSTSGIPLSIWLDNISSVFLAELTRMFSGARTESPLDSSPSPSALLPPPPCLSFSLIRSQCTSSWMKKHIRREERGYKYLNAGKIDQKKQTSIMWKDEEYRCLRGHICTYMSASSSRLLVSAEKEVPRFRSCSSAVL